MRLSVLLLLSLGVWALGCRDTLAPILPREQLAYRSLADGGVYLMRADGSGRRRIWFSPQDGVMCPSWSPDGSAIAFHKFIANQVFVLYVSTGEERQLTSGPDLNQCPMWSPDGTRIAFFRIPTPAPDGYPLYVMRSDGTNATRLGTGTFMADRGSWSPDGKWIAASRYPDNQIVLVNAQTGDAGPTLTSGSGGRAPSWSPDATLITFMSWETGSAAIYLMRANGTDTRQLTPSYVGAPDFADQYPVWTLDGHMITFHRYRPSSVPGIPVATLHIIRLDGTEVRWPAGEAADGDFPIWRPHP